MKILKEDPSLMIISGFDLLNLIKPIIFTAIGFLIIFKPEMFTKNPSQFQTYFGVFFVLIGLLPYLLKNKKTTITIDKVSNKVSIIYKTLFNKQNKEIDIISIKEVLMTNKSNNDKKLSYHSCIILNTGEEIDLTPNGCSSFTLFGVIEINPDIKISKKIADFLNVPFQQMTIKKLFSNAIENIMEASQKGTDEEKKKTIIEMTEKGIINRD